MPAAHSVPLGIVALWPGSCYWDQHWLCKSWSWNLAVLQEAAGTSSPVLSRDAEEEGTVTYEWKKRVHYWYSCSIPPRLWGQRVMFWTQMINAELVHTGSFYGALIHLEAYADILIFLRTARKALNNMSNMFYLIVALLIIVFIGNVQGSSGTVTFKLYLSLKKVSGTWWDDQA